MLDDEIVDRRILEDRRKIDRNGWVQVQTVTFDYNQVDALMVEFFTHPYSRVPLLGIITRL